MQVLLTDVRDEALKLGNQIDSGLVRLGGLATTTTATRALLGNVAIGARLDIVVGDVAAVLGLVPDAVAVDGSARRLARDGDLVALGVGPLGRVAGSRTRAAVDGGASDGIGSSVDANKGKSCGGEKRELHFE